MADKERIERLKRQGWEDMSNILDTHMPINKNRPIFWWYWPAGVAAVMLAVATPLILIKNNSPVQPSVMTDPQHFESLGQDESSITNNSRNEESLSVESSPDQARSGQPYTGIPQHEEEFVQSNLRSDQTEQNQSFTSNGNGTQTPYQGGNRNATARRKPTGLVQIPLNGPKSTFSTDDNSKKITVNELSPQLEELTLLGHPYFLIEPSDRSLVRFLLAKPAKIEMVQSPRKVTAVVFAEMMWSPSDRFGFVNAGPSVNYSMGKWSLGLSAGMAYPLPQHKSFYSANLSFYNQYNFSNANRESADMASPGFSQSSASKAIYYEKYLMKPGLVISLSANREIADRWEIGADFGRIGFRYDFIQKAKPNLSIAASSQVSGTNSLWYGGVSVNYMISRHWKAKGGIKFLNILNTSDMVPLPALTVEYGF